MNNFPGIRRQGIGALMTTTATAPEATTRIPAGTWDVDPVHSTIGFEVKHFGVSTFRGRFNGYEGTLEVSESGLEGVKGEIDAASVDVNDEQLSGHLQSDDFFDTANHPKLRFASTAVEQHADGSIHVTGDLEIRGTTKPVELDVQVDAVGVDPNGNERLGLVASGEIDRTAFGLTYNSTLANGALLIGERVKLVLSVEAAKRA
jgi:polyisoprenoid-binding protein YceI